MSHGVLPAAAARATRFGMGPLARSLHRAGVSANAITVVGFLLVVAGATQIATGHPLRALPILLLGALADTLDGQVARAAGGGTTFGAFLDSAFDRLSDAVLLVAAIALGAARADALLFWAALVALVASNLVPYLRAKAESLGTSAAVGLAPREARLAILLLGVAAWIPLGLPAFTASVAIVAFLSVITSIQRIAHVAAALKGKR